MYQWSNLRVNNQKTVNDIFPLIFLHTFIIVMFYSFRKYSQKYFQCCIFKIWYKIASKMGQIFEFHLLNKILSFNEQ